jgi:ABC-2 type transport system permease protein
MIQGFAVRAVWQREFKRYFRDIPRVASSVARPMVWLFILGIGISPNFAPVSGLGYIEYIFPGMVVMTILFTSTVSAISIIWDRDFGLLKEMLTAPISRSSIVVGKMLGGATICTIQGLIAILLVFFTNIQLLWYNIAWILIASFIVGFMLAGIGVIIASLVETYEGFSSVMNFLIMPLFLASGAVFPLANLPRWAYLLARANPIAYAVDLFRGLMLHHYEYTFFIDMMVISVLTLIVTAYAVYRFRRMAHKWGGRG